MGTQIGEMIDLILVALIAGLITAVVSYVFRSKKKNKNLPPRPVGFPVLGHLHLLKEPVHRCLRDLSQNLRSDVFFLRLGSRRAVVVTSASAAEEFLSQQNDVVFANRPQATFSDIISYNYTVLGSAPYGEHWRRLRRFCTVDIFSPARLRDSSEVRRDEVRALLRTIHVSTSRGNNGSVRVNLRPLFSTLTFNIVMSMIAGKREQDEEAKKFRELIRDVFELAGVTYVGDFLPILKILDFDGFLKRMKELFSRMDKFFQDLVDEHRRNRGKAEYDEKTMIAHLLTLQESGPEYYTDDIIKGLVQVMLLAGTDTASVTLEWAMANLLNHPEVLKKLKTELNDVSGERRVLEDSDASKSTYLNNVVSETLRLYPAAPLLVPHASSADCKVAGYDIPRDTWLLINAWAIQRDTKLWDDPDSFKPERFESETHRVF
ncbi:PREDICTED: cytochrome P450 81E8-like isoform X2 [Camelina sativa]|uniref:Cytochrome P450 81E8-like isoform X2 n=1 Tax=Camelina sativa TaxID=90675 RepID=A0ABM0UQR7_CAMSA|nr:PREDICTED: cytochrome P450 81E8-like isoform X2 [Camelina sativa]